MPVKDVIEKKLRLALSPTALDVRDESHLHAGHAGAPEGGESHFRVSVTAEAFRGKSRLECHRMVNAALHEELAGPIHALAIHASVPGGA